MDDLRVTPQEVKARRAGGQPLILIDVREPAEHQAARIGGAHLIPMGSIPERLQEIEGFADEAELVVFCHHGIRSLQVVNWLRQQGVANCRSMDGGIDRWSLEIDPQVPRYI